MVGFPFSISSESYLKCEKTFEKNTKIDISGGNNQDTRGGHFWGNAPFLRKSRPQLLVVEFVP